MEELSQEYVLTMVFNDALEKEELLKKKCEDYLEQVTTKELKNLIKEFRNLSEDHIKLMKDKMIKLKIIG